MTAALSSSTTSIVLARVRVDGGTQVRAQIDAARVALYEEKYRSGVRMPPPVVFFDGTEYWLADGFHRVAAVRSVGWIDLGVDVRAGTRRDAILFAVGANEEHGAPRTNEDKRRAVETLLRDEEWAQWSNRKIATVCKVSPDLVDRLRKLSLPESGSEQVPESTPALQRRFVTKHGTEATMDTSKIGKAAKEPKCIECGEDDRAMFYAHKSSQSGCQSRCKKCDNAKRVENSKRPPTDESTARDDSEPVSTDGEASPPKRRLDEQHELVRSLTEEGYTLADIIERTGLKKSFIHHARHLTSKPASVLAGAIQDAEVFAESWLARASRPDPRWAAAPQSERDALIVALRACRTAAAKVIQRLNKEAQGV